jgi:hypothetical protein
MFYRSLVTAALVFVAGASGQSQPNDSDNLIVRTRTGTFVGDLNDTYTDVRQFKWIPYAKVTLLPYSYCTHTNDHSHL